MLTGLIIGFFIGVVFCLLLIALIFHLAEKGY